MNGYVAAGYFIPVVSIVVYAAWVIARGRTLSRQAEEDAP